MAKDVFCFICKKPVEVQDNRAIAKLCPEHDTPENRETMVGTPVRQLLGIQDEGLQLMLQSTDDATKADIATITQAIEDLKVQIENLPKETTTTTETSQPNTLQAGDVNEFGEII